MNGEQQQIPLTNGVISHGPAEERFQRQPFVEPPSPTLAEHRRADNRRTLAVVLTLMGSMAILGLLFMLWTVPLRRANDQKPTLSVPDTMLHKQ